MKKLFFMAAMVLSSVGAFAQQAAGTTTLQPKRSEEHTSELQSLS